MPSALPLACGRPKMPVSQSPPLLLVHTQLLCITCSAAMMEQMWLAALRHLCR